MTVISLDVESVLANVHRNFLEVYNGIYDTDWVAADWDTWDFGQTDITLDEYMVLSDYLWAYEWESIPACEVGITDTVEEMCERHTVDIVTARDGHDHNIQAWLDLNDITGWRRFRSCEPGTKHQFAPEYDCFIDDSPNLHDNVSTQYLVRQPWNQNVRNEEGVVPVDTVAEALELIDD